MATKKHPVFKGLSPDEEQLVQNVLASLNDLLTLGQAAPVAPEATQVEEGKSSLQMDSSVLDSILKKLTTKQEEEEEEEKPEDELPLNAAQKEDNGPTNNQKAEARADIQTDVNEENINEVGKALLTLLGKNVQKKKKENEITKSIEKILIPVVKVLGDKMQQQEIALGNIIDALGFSEKVAKSIESTQPVQKSNDRLPLQSDSTPVFEEMLKYFKSQNEEKKQGETYRNDWTGIQKSRDNLSKALPFIFQNNIKGGVK